MRGGLFSTRSVCRIVDVYVRSVRMRLGDKEKAAGSYAKAINNAYGRTGSLFQHPFGRVPITTDGQFWNVIAYIHQNPQKHKFVKDFRDWKWSSYGVLLSDKPTKLQRDTVLDWFGGKDGYLKLHEEWVTDADSKWFAEDDYD